MATGPVTANVVSYLGELFQTGKRPNTILRLLGGMQGGVMTTTSREFPIGTFFDLRSPAQPAVLEGAAAPAAQHRVITQTTNVVQIFHEQVAATYLAQSEKAISGVVPIPLGAAQGMPKNPRDLNFQVMAALSTIAQDLNYSALRGTHANPADPSGTALKTRGIHTAITTNDVDKTGTSAGSVTKEIYRGWVELLVKTVMIQTGYNPDNTWTLVADATQFGNVQAAFSESSVSQAPMDRMVAGLMLRTIYTKFGVINLALEPDMPADEVMLNDFSVAGLVALPVPGKGILFEEPLDKTGSSDKTQIYGQMGVDHGPEYHHGKLRVASGISL